MKEYPRVAPIRVSEQQYKPERPIANLDDSSEEETRSGQAGMLRVLLVVSMPL